VDELQSERDVLHATVTSSEVQLHQRAEEMQRLRDEVTI